MTRRHRNKLETLGMVLLFLFPFIGAALILYGCASYESTKSVHLEDKWWSYKRSVVYDTYECGYEVNFEGEFVHRCSWETNTRCTTERSGKDTPPRPPEIGCEMRLGDSIRDYIDYYIYYRIEETKDYETRHIDENTWHRLEIPSRADITFYIGGKIVKRISQ